MVLEKWPAIGGDVRREEGGVKARQLVVRDAREGWRGRKRP